MKKYTYYTDEKEIEILSDSFKYQTDDIKKEIMKGWFLSNYEDPVHSCPYNGREGGYQFIYGGPYEAYDEIFTEFEEYFNDETLILEVADELNLDCWEWSGHSNDDRWYDEYQESQLYCALDNNPYWTLVNSIDELKQIISLEVKPFQQKTLLKMIFVNLVTLLETYLCDISVSKITENKKLLKQFVSNYNDFKEKKITLSEMYEKYENIEKIAKDILLGINWHRLKTVQGLLKFSFNINVDKKSFGNLCKAVLKRHALVHRNGKIEDGIIEISHSNVEDLISNIIAFVDNIEEQFDLIPRWKKEDCSQDCSEIANCELIPGSKKCEEATSDF
jgi:hypothetical protein